MRGSKPRELYPIVGLRTQGEVCEANFGHHPFEFDIDSYVTDVKNDLTHTINKIQLPSIHSIVLDYMDFWGYSKTHALIGGIENQTNKLQQGIVIIT